MTVFIPSGICKIHYLFSSITFLKKSNTKLVYILFSKYFILVESLVAANLLAK